MPAWEVRWEGPLPVEPAAAWEGFTARLGGWLWPIDYEPRVGGAERGLTPGGGTVTTWEPPHRFVTRAEAGDWYNELDYTLEPRGREGSYLRVAHRTVVDDDYDTQLDACRRHTDLYYHSLGAYLGHFAGQAGTYVSAEAPAASSAGGSAVIRRALGLPDRLAEGDTVRLAGPPAMGAVDGVVDWVSPGFVGVRSAAGLHRIYGRDEWGWPVEVAHHLFGEAAHGPLADEKAWTAWLAGLFPDAPDAPDAETARTAETDQEKV